MYTFQSVVLGDHTCYFSWTRPVQDFYIASIQSTLWAFRKHKEPMSYTDLSARANKS